jgi:hypothetical protein
MSADNDPIADLMSREGLSYPEAVERLAGVKLGATGKFPAGKLEPGDAGELMAALSVVDGRVRLDFGPKPVAWLAIDADDAIALGGALIEAGVSVKFRGAQLMMEAMRETKQ